MERLVSRRKLIAALALLGCAAAGAEPTAPSAQQELRHNARFWEAHERGDLAQLALKKLVAARPDLPEALLELGELDLRMNDFADAARVENELDRRFAASAAAKEFTTEHRIATRDRVEFASVRRLVEIGRTADAQAELKRLFPQGPPGGALGIDYYRLLAKMPHGQSAAEAGLRRLAQDHPDDPRYRLARAEVMVGQRDSAAAALGLLEPLMARDDVRGEDVDRLFASGLERLGVERAPPRMVNAYLVRHPEDAKIASLRSEQARLREERGLLTAATNAQALPDLQRRLSRELSAGRSSAAARPLARLWLDRSRGSLDDRLEPRAAAELRAAVAFYREDYEAQIAVARDLEASGSAAEAEELLRSAARLAPQSAWLFESEVRWLITHHQPDAAMKLLRGRAMDGKWSAQSRDALLAAAFAERASQEASAGHVEAAIAALEHATELDPRDPWTRYRLAEYYRDKGEGERGRSLMNEGVERASDLPDMRYAEALYLSHLEDYPAAFTAIDDIDAARRTDGMNDLHDRMRLTVARAEARRREAAGDAAGARAALLDAEPLAAHSFDRAVELAYAWIALGSAEHGMHLVQPYLDGPEGHDAHRLLKWAQVLNSAEDDVRLRSTLAQLRASPALDAAERADVTRLGRALDLREIRALERQRKLAEAARRLDALLAAEPQDRPLRAARAELYLTAGQPQAARDRLAALAAEDPDDLDVRLTYVRALTESGDTALARSQLEAVEARMPQGDEELNISLARRQLGLGEAEKALRTLEPLLAVSHPRTDVLMLAGRAELARRHLAQARDYFDQAAAGAAGDEALAARRASEEAAEHLQSSVTAGLSFWHQPGDAGMSQLDAVTMPSAWLFGRSDGSHFIVRADAVLVDAGSPGAAELPLIGTVQAAGAGAVERYSNGTQAGVSPGVGYQSDSFAADIGATPLGFLLPNVVGGLGWTPVWHSVDLSFGVERRAVTSSELSYAGLRDPITGTAWGGVVQTGPYAGFGIYHENYDVSGAVKVSEITGTHVLDNQFAGARLSASWKLFSAPLMRIDGGVTLNYWNYQHNLSNYTFGSGGYYSPQSYASVSTPIELTGRHLGWDYKLSGSVSYTVSQVSASAFYPDDPVLQAMAAREPLPAGYSSPEFSGYRSTGFGFTAYAAAERQVTQGLVVGVLLDIDRTDYYHPTTIELYLRHAFAPSVTRAVSPPRPLGPYNP
jgi:cellulose synthase operon protein C